MASVAGGLPHVAAVIGLKLEETLGKVRKEDVKYFSPSATCTFTELGISEEECKKLLPDLIALTGLCLAVGMHCTCCMHDSQPGHDAECGIRLLISWA
jgi:hypothetical protein